MKEINTKYSDYFNQNIKCAGTITNTYKGLIIKLNGKDYISKEDFLINFLMRFRSGYNIYPDKYNQKEYKRFLKGEIENMEKRLENLKFAHKISGRKILDTE
jgi:hypothetical protein